MITYERPKWWQRTGFVAAALGLAGGALAWWSVSPPAPKAMALAGATAASSPLARPMGMVDTALLVTPTVTEDGRPSDFQPDEWAALREAMSKTANPKAETERVVKYLRFQRGFEQWQALQESANVAERHQLAQRLIEQVPDRMRQGELTMGEALMLESALLSDLEPNEDLRRRKLEQAQAMLSAVAPQPDGEQQAREAAMQTEYKRREAAILADWQAKSPADRNQARLEEALESARRAVYTGKN